MAQEELTNNRSVTVAVTSTRISEQCFQQRSAIVLTNISIGGQEISISIGSEAILGTGIVLSVGGTYQDSRDGRYMPSNEQINAISDVAGGVLAVHERILMQKVVGW